MNINEILDQIERRLHSARLTYDISMSPDGARAIIDAYRAMEARAEAAEAKVARLHKALKPFANAVFYDNSDMTVDMSALGYEDCKRAYFAYRAALAAMENTDE